MRCFLAGQSCSADRGQRIYTHITAHNSPIRKNTRFTWKIPTLRGSPLYLKYNSREGLHGNVNIVLCKIQLILNKKKLGRM